MNQNHLKSLCLHFNLGFPKQEPQRVHGGLLHVMWRLNTDKASFAIKQLSKDIVLTDESVIKNYELSERIASRFAALGIPGVFAIEKFGKYLFMTNGIGFLVYPWVDAIALDKDAVSIPQVLEVARILSKIHLMNLNVPEIEDAEFDIYDNNKIVAFVGLAKKQNLPFSADLMENLVALLEINKNYHSAISILKNHTVVSHGDLDQKNVLWDDSMNPILIDWECVRRVNPTYEIINAALDWSGITTIFDKDLFGEMISTYKGVGGIIDQGILEAVFYGVLGNWINWMVYNIQRASNQQDPEQQKIGTEQVSQVLLTILRLKRLIPELIRSISK